MTDLSPGDDASRGGSRCYSFMDTVPSNVEAEKAYPWSKEDDAKYRG